MNLLQVLKQVRYLLRSRQWEGTGEIVFAEDSVHVTTAPEDHALASMISPIALIRPLEETSDPKHDEEPDYLVGTFALKLITVTPGDAAIGENALIGANRTAGASSSKGRGLLEIEEEVFAAIESLNGVDGVEIQCRAKGAAGATIDAEMRYMAFRDYTFEAIVTADRFYHPPRNLAAVAPGGGQVSLTWTLPPDRFDRRQMVLRRASGSTAPATPTAGTGVTLGSDLATSVTDTPGVGTWSYALFCGYTDTGAATNERYSDQVTGTTVTKTAT